VALDKGEGFVKDRVNITTLADPSGNYEVLEPLNDSIINVSVRIKPQ
jgi:hypothetical protein